MTNEPAPSRNDGSRSASSRNNDSRPAFGRNNSNGEVNGFGGGVEHAKKPGKLKGQKMFKSRKSSKSGKNSSKSGNSPNFSATESGPSLLTPKASSAFNCLWLAFTKAPILQYFDPKYHIRIETNASGYAISSVLNKLASGTSLEGVVTKANLGQWYPVAFFSRKMIPVKTWYKTYDDKLLAIVEAFKTWHHYLEGCKHEVLVFTDQNNLRHFMNTKNLSCRPVRWTQKLFQYYFQINYCQFKANTAANALLRFSQKSEDEKKELQAKNGQIFHRLQNLLTNASLASLSFSVQSHLH